MRKYIIGIDEAGRGPLAGPVAVGVVCVPDTFNWKKIVGVNDSKKLSAKNREAIFCRAKELQKSGEITYVVSLVSAVVIDRKGITHAVRLGIKNGLKRLNVTPHKVEVRLDGLLKAPEEYVHQQTIIKGDQKEKVIGLASILAKVTRDRYMQRISNKFPDYDFEVHKGYGTKKHVEAIRKKGLSNAHRKSFCRSVHR